MQSLTLHSARVAAGRTASRSPGARHLRWTARASSRSRTRGLRYKQLRKAQVQNRYGKLRSNAACSIGLSGNAGGAATERLSIVACRMGTHAEWSVGNVYEESAERTRPPGAEEGVPAFRTDGRGKSSR